MGAALDTGDLDRFHDTDVNASGDIGWQKPFPPLRDETRLIPRQFACAIAPDPIAFLLPIGHQQATRSA